MAKKGSFSKVYDKNGDHVDVEAVRFDGTRTVQMQGDVTASQTWNGDPSSPLTLNVSIGAKKVTQDKIGDKAVGTGQMADGSVGLTQMAASAMTDTVSANNSKLVTSQGVNAAIAAATLNRGKDYGPMSVDEINAISETIPTGSTAYVEHLGASDAKVINDGYSDGTMASFSVEVGEDLKYYRAPDNSLHGWYSTEANVKIKQPANYSGGIAVDSAQDASSGSAGIEFIQSFKQDTNGNIRDIVKAQVDIVDSTSSTRTNAAATPNSVKSAYDLANTANTGLANKLDKTGDGKDVTATFTEASSRANIGTGEKLSVIFGKIKKWFTDLKALAFKDTVSDSDISGTISDNHIASASTWNGKYALPNGGIPKTDLASAVQTSLDKADSALQSSDVAHTYTYNSEAPISGKGVTEKYLLKAFTLTSSDNIDNLDGKMPVTVRGTKYLFQGPSTVGGTFPGTQKSFQLSVLIQQGYFKYMTQELWYTDGYDKYHWVRKCVNGTWQDWKIHWDEPTSTYSSSGSQPVNGQAVASAISRKEDNSNKVTSWQATPDDTHYPSEKLVKDGLDAKADANNSVRLADSVYRRLNETGDGWNKLAETTFTKANINAIGFFDVYYGQLGAAVACMTVKINVRVDGLGSAPMIKDIDCIRISGQDTYPLCIVARGLTGNATIELWGFLPKSNISMAVVYRAGTNAQSDWKFSISKSAWTFYNTSGSSTAKPVADAGNNIQVVDASYTTLQKNITSPTNNNLVAMDANGLVKNSGVAVLPSTSTWDGTSDAKVPTAKAVQAKLDAISTAAGAEAEVTAAALDDLDARMQSVEDAVNSDNIGDKIADSLDAQVLKVGGQDVVANIKYVAAQSGGGGDLMKTVAGTQTSVLRFMNDSEAVSIWNDAKQAAANAS